MSVEYDKYLINHTNNVCFCYKLFWGESLDVKHDASKYSNAEYPYYDLHWTGKEEDKTEESELEYKVAWLHHIHNNPHHWQYWVLLDEDEKGNNRFKPLPIPDRYIKELIADWASFSFDKKDPDELFKWYRKHRNKIIMDPNSKRKVEKGLVYANKKMKNYFKEH